MPDIISQIGAINGIPAHANPKLVAQLLKTEFGFEGVVMSDYDDVQDLVNQHHYVSTFMEAVDVAVQAGLDMSMVSQF